jgi:hypothetical protein
MPALDAYHLRAGLIDELGPHTLGRVMVNNYLRSMRGEVDEYLDGTKPLANPNFFDADLTGDGLADRIVNAAGQALPFYVAPQMNQLVDVAAQSMPDEDILPSDLPHPDGFMFLPEGVKAIEVRGRPVSYRGILWSQRAGGVDLYWLVDKYDPHDSINIELRGQVSEAEYRKLPRLGVGHTSRIAYHQTLPRMMGPSSVLPDGVKMQVTHLGIVDGQDRYGFQTNDPSFGPDQIQQAMTGFGERPDYAHVWLLACWRLMQQSITSLTTEEPTRQMRKLWRKVPMKDHAVVVVKLRVNDNRERAEETSVEWSHRWLRRGHWRNQPCKDDDGQWTRRVIWIHPTVCGPEGKPLLIRDHVYALVR